jgi:hypothetical protein
MIIPSREEWCMISVRFDRHMIVFVWKTQLISRYYFWPRSKTEIMAFLIVPCKPLKFRRHEQSSTFLLQYKALSSLAARSSICQADFKCFWIHFYRWPYIARILAQIVVSFSKCHPSFHH